MRSPGLEVIAIGNTVRLPARLTEVAKVGAIDGSSASSSLTGAESGAVGTGLAPVHVPTSPSPPLSEVAESGRKSISRQPAPEIGVQRSSKKRGKITPCSTFITRSMGG